MSTEIAESEVVQEGEYLPAAPPAPRLAVTPQVEAKELVARLAVIKEAMDTAMIPDVDYGVIPGTGSKPTLLKPGAEKLAVLFQLDVQLSNEKRWEDGGHLTVVAHATVWHAPTGMRLGYGEGICSTREKKYGKRQQNRACPACGQEAIIKGKAEYGGGWVCFKKKGGCGAKYADDDATIVSQVVGEVDNPDIADTYNTVDKMASKRGRVDAVLSVTGASALFTQDIEDRAEAAIEAAPAAPVPLADAEDREELATAARGLLPRQVRLTMGQLRIAIPDVVEGETSEGRRRSLFAAVPLDAVDRLKAALEGLERPKVEAPKATEAA